MTEGRVTHIIACLSISRPGMEALSAMLGKRAYTHFGAFEGGQRLHIRFTISDDNETYERTDSVPYAMLSNGCLCAFNYTCATSGTRHMNILWVVESFGKRAAMSLQRLSWGCEGGGS